MKRLVHGVLALVFLVGTVAGPALAEDNELWIEGKGDKEIFPQINLPSFAPVIERLGKSVVNIRTKGKDTPAGRRRIPGYRGRQGQEPFSPFDFFFRLPPEHESRSFSSLGSGFVIHPDGYIVTNHHVVDKAEKIMVSFRDEKKTYRGELVGGDAKTDLALIKVNYAGKLPAAVLGDSDSLKPGDWVIAIGNPFHLGHTATVGIVSAKSRRIPGGKQYDNFIQTDASINPGNSGGPLFNSKGEVVGVNTAIFSPGRFGAGGFNIGIGFAIPINFVKGIVSQIKEKGRVTRGWLGVLIQPVSPDVAEALGLEEARGALVADVKPDSPASKGGFQRGDVIVKYDGQPVEENDDLPLMVAETEIGKRVDIEIIREKKRKTLRARIQELKEGELKIEAGPTEETELGLTVQELTPDIARSLGFDDTSGVVVTNVQPDSPAANSGLRRGDVVLEVGSKPVNTTNEFREATRGLKKNKPLLLLVRRGDNTIFFTLKVE